MTITSCLLLAVKQLMELWSAKTLQHPTKHQVRHRGRINPHTNAWTWWAFSHTVLQETLSKGSHVTWPRVSANHRAREDPAERVQRGRLLGNSAFCWLFGDPPLFSPLQEMSNNTDTHFHFIAGFMDVWEKCARRKEETANFACELVNFINSWVDRGVSTQEGWWVLKRLVLINISKRMKLQLKRNHVSL